MVQARRWQDGPREMADVGGVRSRRIHLGESPLTWLHARGQLTDRQLAAGEQLRSDYERACLGARVTMLWDEAAQRRARRTPPVALEPGVRQIAAKDRFDGALAFAGSGLADILWRLVCANEGLVVAESGLGWPRRSGKLVLSIALDRVADYHRLP